MFIINIVTFNRISMTITAVLCLSQIPIVLAQDGPLTVSSNGHWFEYRDSGEPFFMAGAGGPEGFFYETDERKQEIVDELIASGANALYVHSIRSFEGDGFPFEDPYNINEDIDSGVNQDVLNNWRGFLEQLDNNKIVTWFHILDDTARPWGCALPLSIQATSYIETIVKQFRDLDHLVWLSGEEYLMGTCSKAEDDALMSAIAAEIRKHDTVHPIGVHHNNGQAMQFGNDPNVNVFAQQICGSQSVRNPDGMHDAASFGDWVYVMAECHPWHKSLIESGDRTPLRLSNWATAMAGGYVLMYDAYECPNKLCTRTSDGGTKEVTPGHDPSNGMLQDLARLHQFMLASEFHTLTPSDNLANGDTQWVMGNPNTDTYIAYANNNPDSLGVINLFATAVYRLRWFDPATGTAQIEQKTGSLSPFTVPAGFGDEVALSISLDSSSSVNRPPIANDDSYQIAPDETLSINAAEGVLANDFDFENDSITAELLSDTGNGELTLDSDGSFSYQPNDGFAGLDSFTYRANDPTQASNTATVTINVSDVPIVELWLVNAGTDQRTQRLLNNPTVNIDNSGIDQFSIEAEVDGAGSIRFVYSGLISGNRTENEAPYSLFGDTSGDFNGENLTTGTLNVTATAYSGENASGDAIAETSQSIRFADTPQVKAADLFCAPIQATNGGIAMVCL